MNLTQSATKNHDLFGICWCKAIFYFLFQETCVFSKKNEHVDSKLDRSSFAQLTCGLIIEDPVKT
jgi:hypothetical protein